MSDTYQQITLANKVVLPVHHKLLRDLMIPLMQVKNRNQDLVIVIDGLEGSGKSTLGRQIGALCAHQLSGSFTIDDIHFELASYFKRSSEGPKYQINMMDETRAVLNRKRSMSKEAVNFTNYLSECRKKNQVHIICLPAFHDLDINVSLWRMRMLFHCDVYEKFNGGNPLEWDNYELIQGDFSIFDTSNKNMINKYVTTSAYKYRYPKPHSSARFQNLEVFSQAELDLYEQRKDESRKGRYTGDNKEEDRLCKAIAYLIDQCGETQESVGRVLGVSKTHVGQLYRGFTAASGV